MDAAATRPHFSWRRVRAEDAAAARAPPGSYAARAFDQHSMSWCGCCYLVAAVQCAEDRGHVAAARRAAAAGAPPPRRARLSLQRALDHYGALDAEPGWNACHGGFSLHVFRCMAEGRCPLVAPPPHPEWRGHPRPVSATPLSTAGLRVVRPRRLAPDAVRAELLARGPVVLEVNAATLKSVDARGVVTDLAPRGPNHAVAVVGWTTRAPAAAGEAGEAGEGGAAGAGVACWVVRNSWGARRVPRALPSDFGCVSHEGNACEVEWEAWSGDPADPGFVLLPMAFAPLHATAPSPWVAADVEVVAA